MSKKKCELGAEIFCNGQCVRKYVCGNGKKVEKVTAQLCIGCAAYMQRMGVRIKEAKAL